MASSFKGWGSSWSSSWGVISSSPDDMVGSAGFALTASAQATALAWGSGATDLAFGAFGDLTASGGVVEVDIAGSASFTFSAIGLLVDPNAPEYKWDTTQGKAGKGVQRDPEQGKDLMRGYIDRINRESAQRQKRIQDDDKLATEFIMALVQMELV